jgi:CheY-like chemotaxis protein
VVVRLALDAHQVRISVADNGVGIPTEFVPHVFDRFRQADSTTTRSHGGLGLGLALVRHLTELHGGRVQAQSEGEGRGAVFTILLPRLTAEARKETSVTTRQARSLAEIRLLIVDDDPDLLEVMRTVLEREKAHVHATTSGREALLAVETFKPDVLVSNLRLPDLDGYTLIQAVRALGPERGGGIPAVALTGYIGTEDRQRAFLAGFQAHLAKPVDPSELIAVIATLAPRGA